MPPVDTTAVRDLLETAVTAVSILGGVMAYASGYAASRALAEGLHSEILGQRVNEGIGEGFAAGWPLAVLVFIIGAWI